MSQQGVVEVVDIRIADVILSTTPGAQDRLRLRAQTGGAHESPAAGGVGAAKEHRGHQEVRATSHGWISRATKDGWKLFGAKNCGTPWREASNSLKQPLLK